MGRRSPDLGSRWTKKGAGGLVFGLAAVLLLTPSVEIRAQERARVEVPFRNGVLLLIADKIESASGGQLIADGRVEITFEDMRLTAERITYDPTEQKVFVEGEFELTRGPSWIRGTSAEINLRDDTGTIENPFGFTDEQVFVRARRLIKTGPQTFVAEDGFITACEDAVPKWSFRVKRATIDVNRSARFSNTLFRVKQVPLFYLPYVYFPAAKKERSSGFMLPSIGNSNNKGFRLTNRFYLVMGRSADIMLQHDYYSLRGHGGALDFRTRPNQTSRLDLIGEFVNDRLGQGGASLEGIGTTRFGNGFRAVADFNLVSNFRFRQTFSDSFFTATRPTQESRIFLTNNYKTRSFNLLLSREETQFRSRNTVIQATPTILFRITGQRLGGLPIHLDLDSSVSAINRTDALIETPEITQRFDLFPKAYFGLPLFQGLRLTPSLGIRQTFYSDGIEASAEGTPEVTGDSVHREYLELQVDLKGWHLAKVYESDGARRWKHSIEPVARYRLIRGIDNFDRIIRFDSLDAVADTNEIEYALVNRLFVKASDDRQAREWLSFEIAQKHFFDETFGGAIVEGAINQFFPLNTLTGLPYTVGPRDFSPLTTVVRLTPMSRTSFDFRADYDTQTGDFRSFSATGFLRRQDWTFATTYFATGELVEGIGRSNQIQGRAGFGSMRGISAFGAFSYDIVSSRVLNYLFRANYGWDCCGIALEVGGFNLANREENQIRFSFTLKGIGSFGTIRRPDVLF